MLWKALRIAAVPVLALMLISCTGSKPASRAPSAEFMSTTEPSARVAVAAAGLTPPSTPRAPSPGAQTASGLQSAVVLRQPPKTGGGLIPSAWRQPEGSASDRSVWENFLFDTAHTITELRWLGAYDPDKVGTGGPVLNFTVDIYGAIATGSEPDLSVAPLVHYVVGGNAGESAAAPVAGEPAYEYRFVLPKPFQADPLKAYWVQIVAFQAGEPDWGFLVGSLGDGRHYRLSGAPGEGYYHQIVPEDVALELVAPAAGVPTPVPNAARSLEEIAAQMANLPPAEEVPVNAEGVQDVMLVVSRSGYTPVHFSVKAGVPVRLTFRQLGYVPGGNELNVRWGPDEGTYIMLASISDSRVLEFTPQTPGEYRFSCPHDWYWGVMTVSE